MIHLFSQNGLQIAVDVNTGNIFLFDEMTAKILATSPDRPPTLEEAQAELAGSCPEGVDEAAPRRSLCRAADPHRPKDALFTRIHR